MTVLFGEKRNFYRVKSYSKIDLSFQMIAYMRTHYMVTSKDLAEEFKMSRREVFRYIKIFKKNNIVKTHRGKYGYIEYIGGYAWR